MPVILSEHWTQWAGTLCESDLQGTQNPIKPCTWTPWVVDQFNTGHPDIQANVHITMSQIFPTSSIHYVYIPQQIAWRYSAVLSCRQGCCILIIISWAMWRLPPLTQKASHLCVHQILIDGQPELLTTCLTRFSHIFIHCRWILFVWVWTGIPWYPMLFYTR